MIRAPLQGLHACKTATLPIMEREVMVLFLMLVCQDNVPVPAPAGAAGADVEQWVTDMDRKGARVIGDALAPDSQAMAVRVRNDQLHTTQGAFLGTNGALLGFDVLDCRDLDEAVEIAATHPLARRCVLEIRPVAADQ